MADMDAVVYSESVRVEAKVFYIDLKQNNRGRYLKLSETGANKPRSTIIVPASSLSWFTKLLEYYLQTTGTLVDKQLCVESKVFVFNQGENQRGRFLRITETGIGHPAGRNSLVVPSGGEAGMGWATLRDSIQRICAIAQVPQLEQDEEEAVMCSSRPCVGPGPAPLLLTLSMTSSGAPMLSVGQKRFYFDTGDKGKGDCLRVTEVVRQERSLLVIPTMALSLFQDALTRCVMQLRKPPSSPAEFGREWARNCLCQHDRYEYLNLVGPAGLSALFKESLSCELLGNMLVVLDCCWMDAAAGGPAGAKHCMASREALAEEAMSVAHIMQALTFAGGFPLNVRLMTGTARRAAVSVLEALRHYWPQDDMQATHCSAEGSQCSHTSNEHLSRSAPASQAHSMLHGSGSPGSPNHCHGSSSPHGCSGYGHYGRSGRCAHGSSTHVGSPASEASAWYGSPLRHSMRVCNACSVHGNMHGSVHGGMQGSMYGSRHCSNPAKHQGRQVAGWECSEIVGGQWSGDVLLAHLWHVYVVAPQAAPRLL